MKSIFAFLLAASTLVAQTAPRRAPQSTAPARSGPAVSYKDLKYPPLRPIQIPNIATSTLPNGMRLYLLEDHELPLVNATALVRTGNLFDPRDKIGLATLTGMVMRTGGTRNKTGDQLNEELENIAASVEAGIEESSGSVSFSALKENADEVLGIFKDVITAPEFRQDKLDLAKSQIRSSISRRNDQAASIAQREFANIIYGKDTPYGWEEEYATVDRITRDDLRSFYQRYFFPANIMLAVYGDFDTAEMKAKIEKLFADFTVQQQPVPDFPKVGPAPAGGIFIAEKSDVTQTFFSLGQRGGEFRDKDYPALEIMADILGGGFQSRLFKRVRTQMGNAYDIGASWSAKFDHPGVFEISGSTKSLSTVETIQAIREEVDRIRTAEVTDAELKTAKDTALNSLVFAFDTKTKALGRLLTYEYFGYPKDFIQQYQKGLEAVTRAEVLSAAKAHLDPAKFIILAVGNPQDFGKPLDTLGSPPVKIDLTIPAPKTEAAAASQSSLEKGKQLLARAQQAVGGAEKLAAVKDATESTEYQLPTAAGTMQVKQTDRWLAPGVLREDRDMGAQKLAIYCDGKSGWLASRQGAAPLNADQLREVRAGLFREYVPLLLSDRLEGRSVNAVSENTIEISDKAGNLAQLVLDPATGLPSRVLYKNITPAGTPVSMQEDYSDFRDVAGIKMPYKIALYQGGQKLSDMTVTEIRLNTGLKLEELRKQP